MKLHQHLSKNFLVLFIITLLVTGVVSYFAIKDINVTRYKQALLSEINIIKIQLPLVEDLNKFAQEVKTQTQHRLTLIDEDGLVIAESDTLAKKMENHADRYEVRMANEKGVGYSIRHSKTLDKDFLYAATAFMLNNKPIVVRLSSELESVTQELYSMWIKVTLIFSIAMAFGFYIIFKLNNSISKEINQIVNSLMDISNKKYNYIVDSSFSDEFSKIKTYMRKLSSKLEKRDKQKRKYTAKIKLISKQRSDIISAISHEFKNPIASVVGYSQTLLEDPEINQQIRERFLAKINKNAQKISYMIDRLALAIKFENGDFTPKKSEIDLYTIAKDVVNDFRDKNPQRSIEITGEPSRVNADATMIEMVIVNLIENALKYSEDEIIVEVKDRRILVKDFGIGIAKNELDKVTNKFYRSNTLSWDNSIGLGLALVKYILNLHKSELEIKSEKAKGSEFSFKL